MSAEVSPSGVGTGYQTYPGITLWTRAQERSDIPLFRRGFGAWHAVWCYSSGGERQRAVAVTTSDTCVSGSDGSLRRVRQATPADGVCSPEPQPFGHCFRLGSAPDRVLNRRARTGAVDVIASDHGGASDAGGRTVPRPARERRYADAPTAA